MFGRYLKILMQRILFLGALLLLMPFRSHALPSDAGAADSLTTTADSTAVVRLKTELAAARLAEADLKMEVERLRMPIAADSAERVQRRLRIDSLRRTTQAYPVVVRLYAKRGGHTPASRAARDVEAIDRLGRQLTLKPDSLAVEHSDIVSDLIYGEKVIVTFTDQDGLWEGITRQELADSIRNRVVVKLQEMHETYGWRELIKRVALFLLVIVGQYALFRLTNWAFRKVRRRICRRRQRMKSILIQNYELLDTRRQVKLLLFGSNIARYVVILIQLMISVPLLFAIFPATQTFAYATFSYIWTPLHAILLGIVDYIPNLFTIAVIVMV